MGTREEIIHVRQLLDGSLKINEMRKEIKQVILIVLGIIDDIVRQEGLREDESSYTNSATLSWKIEKKNKVFVYCVILLPNGKSVNIGREVYDLPGEIPLEYVNTVYEQLPQFLAQLSLVFPPLKNKIEIFLAVATK